MGELVGDEMTGYMSDGYDGTEGLTASMKR